MRWITSRLSTSDRSEGVVTSQSASTALHSLDYLRRLNADVFEWYKLADSKAQFLLSLDGIFLTVIAAGGILNGLHNIGLTARIFLGGFGIAITASIVCAVICLFSRMRNANIKRVIETFGVDSRRIETYVPEIAWWFGMIAVLDTKMIASYLVGFDDQKEAEALATQIAILSRNVLRKHRWANRGWIATGTSLVFLVMVVAGYVVSKPR